MKTGINKIVESSLFTKLITPFVLFVLCFVIRLFYLTAQDICIDEPFSVYHAQFSISEIIQWLKPTNNPPLFEIILHFWIKLFGISAFSVRFLPLLFGSLAVIYIYKTGLTYFSYRTGVAASLLYVFSSHAIYYAHDCRVYTLFLFLAMASVYYASKIISGGFLKPDLIFLCIINVLLTYSHYFGFIVWFVEFLGFLIFSREQIKSVLVLFTITTLFYLPQLLILVDRFLFSTNTGTWVKEPVGAESIYNMLWLFSNMPLMAVLCILIIAASLVKFFFFRKKENDTNNPVRYFIYLCFFLPFVLMFLISYKIPVYNGRYLFFILPFYYLSVCIMAFDLFKDSKIKIGLILALVVGFMFTFQANPDKKRKSKEVTEYVNSIKKPNDLVIICTHEFITNYAYYTDENLFKVIGGGEYGYLEKELRNRNIYALTTINEIDPSLISNAERVIYLDAGADFSNPGNNVLGTLESKLKLDDKKYFEEIFNVYIFSNTTVN